jgi:GH24 family phage-related lysozyme (muramidase)
MKNRFLFDEGVKEILMSLFSMGAMAHEAQYVAKQLEKRPEPIEQKIEALKKAEKVHPNLSFDQALQKMINYYNNQHHQVIPHPIKEDKLLKFIKKHEHFSPTPYKDYKQISIGYGTKAKPNDVEITEQEAEKRLASVVKTHKDSVIAASKSWGYNWTDNQINALTSFCFNVGNIRTLTKNGTRDNNTIVKKMLEYDKAGGTPLPGLTIRRQEEQRMFLSNL